MVRFCSSGTGARKFHVADPVALAPRQALFLALAFEGCRSPPQERWVHILESIDTDHGVEATCNPTGDNRGDSTRGADVKSGRLCTEAVRGHSRGILDGHLQRARRAGGPNAAVLGAERASAGASRDLQRSGYPVQLERDISAVAVSADQHGRMETSGSEASQCSYFRRPPRAPHHASRRRFATAPARSSTSSTKRGGGWRARRNSKRFSSSRRKASTCTVSPGE